MHHSTNRQGLNMGTNKLPASLNSFIAHFGVTSSALYASAPNHVFGQQLGCPVRESRIRGCSGSRTVPSAGLLDYEDTRLKTSSRVRMGLSLAWKASLATRIFKISYHCNRLCVTLTLSGVYINRRVVVRRQLTPYNNHTIG